MKDNIILIGFMGCGKTSVGIRLSYKRRQTMIDTDKWIEKNKKRLYRKFLKPAGKKLSAGWKPSVLRSWWGPQKGRSFLWEAVCL